MSRRATTRATLALAAVVGCAAPVVLELPDRERAESWVVVASGAALAEPFAQVLGPDDHLTLGADGSATLEVLAFAAPVGPLTRAPDEEPLPAPLSTHVLTLGGDAPRWTPTEAPSEAARSLRVPRRAGLCPPLDAESQVLTDADREGVVGLVPIGRGRVAVFTAPAWWLLHGDSAEPLTPTVPNARAVGIDFLSAVWIATPDAVWTVYGDDPRTATATRTWLLPPGLLTTQLAAPKPARLFLLSHDGALYLSTREETREVYRFAGAEPGTLGQLVVDGHGVLAAFGGASTFVRVSEEGAVTELALPASAIGESALSIARLGDLGIVVGTNVGLLRAERLGFEPIPDPAGVLRRGVPVRALHVDGETLFFGGGSGLFGLRTASGMLCMAGTAATSAVRYILPFKDSVLAGGHPLANALALVQLSRFRLR